MSKKILIILIGLGGGILEGAGLAAFITLLDIVPRLAQLTKTKRFIKTYETVVTISAVCISFSLFINLSLNLNKYLLIPIGLCFGIYIGLLAGALAEVLNVLPVLERRLKIKKYVYYPIIAISLGKIVGSLIKWIIL